MASRLPLPFDEGRPAPATPGIPLIALVGIAAAASMAAGWTLFGGIGFGLLLLATVVGVALGAGLHAFARSGEVEEPVIVSDLGLVRAAYSDSRDASAMTDRAGRLVCTGPYYDELFGPQTNPREIAFEDDGPARLTNTVKRAWRDGFADVDELRVNRRIYRVSIRRAGQAQDHIAWRFRAIDATDHASSARAMITGSPGRRLSVAGVMTVLVDAGGMVLAFNPAFAQRAMEDPAEPLIGRSLLELLRTDDDGTIRIARDDDETPPIRIIPVGLADEDDDAEEAPMLFLLIDEDPDAMSASAARGAATGHLHALLAMLPLGLALTERDGRFLFMNAAFARAAGQSGEGAAIYPSDLVVEEDKGTVADAIHRFAAGRALPGDLAIRLKAKPEEPVALTIANAKGLGDAAVLLSLKDDSEESKLKRQIAQATKMQAVGQLAGGVAHDFNNILTAIIGHCDLMAMRHTPGDIDYDDIQQIKHNSNRAAALTRQLLAFSRQQTLRPQILQLPEIISEITNLLRRLLGERIKLEVKHGRDLGLVRADPGQLEQVIVNLAVNARDAMPEGGRLTLQTYAVSQQEVRRMRSDIMPIAEYTALKVSDTGTGIPSEIISKIFEPFFTTKEVGKGTGLGLSTVYGIVKQTDGFIFADSEMGVGTAFTIYLPVHHAAKGEEVATVKPVEQPSGEVWGTGTILLVEDEAMVRAVAERALTRQGYRVLAAGTGEEALELLESEDKIDLLISDVVMPGLDGPAVVRKAREFDPDLKVLFMSGYAEEQLRKSIDVENVHFLSKPFSVQQLAVAARDAMA